MIEITIPRLGWSMEEGTFSEWLKRDGDWVEKGDMLFVLESDKAAQEIESFESGVLRLGTNGPRPGKTVKIGQVIGYLVARDEAATFQAPAGKTAHVDRAEAPVEAPAADLRETVQEERALAPVAARQAVASPRARRAADERSIDWRTLDGTGRGGRVRERDVLSAAVNAPQATTARTSATRRTIAQRMAASTRETAAVTLTTKVDAANLVNLRAQFAAGKETAPSITDIVVKLVAKAMEDHPDLNSRWQDDQIIRFREIHIGIAVDTEAGLLVPVLRDVPGMTLKQVASTSRTLIEKARGRRLAAEELRGGTFTVTNLGMYGIDAFTPIINLPETAILGIGAVRREAMVLDDDRLSPGYLLT
ncbi:MAG: dihydrolipoamide acetyltransferase family protein, partial [Pirellulales bacterium]